MVGNFRQKSLDDGNVKVLVMRSHTVRICENNRKLWYLRFHYSSETNGISKSTFHVFGRRNKKLCLQRYSVSMM